MRIVCGSNQTTLCDVSTATVRANYMRFMGQDAMAMMVSPANDMTKNLFEYIEMGLPQISSSVQVGSTLILVNHNDKLDSITGRDQYTIDSIIDVHPLSLSIDYPIMCRIDNVGSTATLIAEIFLEQVYAPSRPEAILLLTAIIDDTDFFERPTTTDRDKHAVERLNQIAGIDDIQKFILELKS